MGRGPQRGRDRGRGWFWGVCGSPITEGHMMVMKFDHAVTPPLWRREQFYEERRLRGCLKKPFLRDWERGVMRFETRGGRVFAGIRNRRVPKKLARPAPRSDELEFSDSL